MAARVLVSDPAREDIDGIWDHLAHDASPEIADFVAARVFEVMYRAAERPLIYRKRTEFFGEPRRINVFSYATFFDVLEGNDGIFVWRVVHARRDLYRVIGKPAGRRRIF
ncbi:MAG: type II toxin-antitoxin system RelE/ParE family toxin [Rhizomicrobium sp.]